MIREYECRKHGYFEVQRRISEPTTESCPECGKPAERVYTEAPKFSVQGGTPRQPDVHVDEKEYEGWQRSKWKEYEEKLHPDNAGKTEKLDVKSITGVDSPTPIPDALNY
jgi:putative FmdB family regulatory protein